MRFAIENNPSVTAFNTMGGATSLKREALKYGLNFSPNQNLKSKIFLKAFTISFKCDRIIMPNKTEYFLKIVKGMCIFIFYDKNTDALLLHILLTVKGFVWRQFGAMCFLCAGFGWRTFYFRIDIFSLWALNDKFYLIKGVTIYVREHWKKN